METGTRRINIMKLVLIGIYLVLTTSGVVLMKLGGNAGTISLANKEITVGMSLISAAGFLCYICSFLLYTRIVMMFDLSYIVPICTGIVQIATLVTACLVLKEPIHLQGIIGVILIIIGIAVMNIKK